MPGSEKVRPLIFISHSAKDPVAKAVLRKLYRTLGRDFEVLLDRERLQASDDWRRQLHTWMGLCNGAVLLISEDAFLRSPWVYRESTFLGYRNEDEEEFVLVPVILPPVTKQKLRRSKKFKPLNLDGVQVVEGGTPDEIAREVAAVLGKLTASAGATTLQKVEERVSVILYEQVERRYPNPKLKFDAAAAKMRRRVRYQPGRSYSQQFARHLLTTSLKSSTEALVALTEYFADTSQAEKILDSYLRPFWVEPRATEALARTHKLPRGRRAVGVNASEYPDTCEDYLARACGVIREWIYAKVGGQPGFEDDGAEAAARQQLEEEIRRQLAPKLGFPRHQTPTLQAVEADLYRREPKQPFFILVPQDYDEEQVAWLRGRFDRFTFFFMYGEQPPAADALEAGHVILLDPPLAAGQELEVSSILRYARGEIVRTR